MIIKSQVSNKIYYDKSVVAPRQSVGAQVYTKCHRIEGPNKKVAAKFDGPYRVVKILPLNKFQLVHERTMKLTVCHWNKLKIIMSDLWSMDKFSLQEVDAERKNEVERTP